MLAGSREAGPALRRSVFENLSGGGVVGSRSGRGGLLQSSLADEVCSLVGFCRGLGY